MDTWEQKVKEMTQRTLASGVDWSKANVDPKDVGFSMGPMMTEEQFREHCRRTGTTPPVLKKK